MLDSISDLILYICRVRVYLLFLKGKRKIIFGLRVKVYTFSPGGINFTALFNIFRLMSLKVYAFSYTGERIVPSRSQYTIAFDS